jgi:hypothetical protein
VHCLRMRENARPLCLERRAFRSQNVRHSLLCCVFSESVSSIGTSTFCTKPPSAMAFSRMASFSGASGSFPSVTAAWRMTLCSSAAFDSERRWQRHSQVVGECILGGLSKFAWPFWRRAIIGRGFSITSSTHTKINYRSYTETELVEVDDFMPAVCWTRSFLAAQGYHARDNILFQDNKSAILLEKMANLPAAGEQGTLTFDILLSSTEFPRGS